MYLHPVGTVELLARMTKRFKFVRNRTKDVISESKLGEA